MRAKHGRLAVVILLLGALGVYGHAQSTGSMTLSPPPNGGSTGQPVTVGVKIKVKVTSSSVAFESASGSCSTPSGTLGLPTMTHGMETFNSTTNTYTVSTSFIFTPEYAGAEDVQCYATVILSSGSPVQLSATTTVNVVNPQVQFSTVEYDGLVSPDGSFSVTWVITPEGSSTQLAQVTATGVKAITTAAPYLDCSGQGITLAEGRPTISLSYDSGTGELSWSYTTYTVNATTISCPCGNTGYQMTTDGPSMAYGSVPTT